MRNYLKNYYFKQASGHSSYKKKFILLGLFLFCSGLFLQPGYIESSVSKATTFNNSSEFPVPKGFEHRVQFWVDVYSKYSYDQILVHGIDNLIVYGVIDLTSDKAKKLSRKQRKNLLKKQKRKYSHLLKKIYVKKRDKKPLTREENRIAKLVKTNFLHHANNIRLQNGQKDRFEKGLQRSGKVMYRIKEVLKKEGLPEQLMYLPHVESSFNYEAYSSVGAAGIWQFMRSTGRSYMTIQYYLDERRDPFTATHAAVKLLKMKREKLGSWPLALTAYNHGLNGMKRAKKKVGSSDIQKIIKNYRSRTFGFASKNFYAEFLAASQVAQNYLKYFGPIQFDKPFLFETIAMRHYVNFGELARQLQLTEKTLIEYNPAFKEPILSGQKRIPAGYELKVPVTRKNIYAKRYWEMPEGHLYASQIRDTWYRVQKGDALSIIARRYGVSVRSLQEANNIRGTRIYYRQKLNIPTKSGQKAQRTVTVAKKKAIQPRNEQYFTISIGYDENLGLYSRWAKVSQQHIRNFNNLRRASSIQLGNKLKIPATSTKKIAFQDKRETYHAKKERSFYAKNQVEKINRMKLTSGDTVWKICNEHKIPLWLFQKHNPRINMNSPLPLGTQVAIPVTSSVLAKAK